jgi:hypothetical protein
MEAQVKQKFEEKMKSLFGNEVKSYNDGKNIVIWSKYSSAIEHLANKLGYALEFIKEDRVSFVYVN